MNIYTNSPVVFDNKQKATQTVYSDRLFQWDYKKYNSLSTKHFGNEGQSFCDRTPSKIESFLSEYLGQDIVLCKIEKHENRSTGYPLWRFDYKLSEPTTTTTT